MLAAIFRRQKVFLLTLFLSSVLGGVLLTQLPVQLYPQTQRPRVFVRINHTGYTAVDFSRQYGDEVESGFLTIEGIDSLEVEYRTDASDFRITFDWKVDSDLAKADVEAAMSSIRTSLPEDIRDDYSVRFFTGENAGFLLLGVRSDSTSPKALYGLMKSALENRLARVEDAETVEINNIEDREVEVILKKDALLAYGLTITEVDSAFRAGYLPVPLGSVEEGGQDYSVRFSRGIDSIYELEDLSIAERGDVSVRLADVADIAISYTLPGQALVINGTPAIRINATPRDGGNIRQMSEDILKILEESIGEGILPGDTSFQLYVDPAEYINRSIRNVVQAALLGAGLAMLIVLLTLGELRNTLLIGISIPVTMILSFILMYFFDVSLNLISLGGIALAVGMIIDPSIVVLENIHRHYIEADEIPTRGALRSLILRSVGEVAAPVTASTLTTVLVFLPISFTAPLTNAILGDQASAVIFAMILSLFISLTLIPIIALRLHPPKERGSVRSSRGLSRWSEAAMFGMSSAYRKALGWLLSGRVRAASAVLGSFLILVLVVQFLMPLIPREIISPPASNRVVVFFRSTEISDRVQIVEEIVPELERRVQVAAGESVTGSFALVSGRFNILFINFTDAGAAAASLGELERVFVSDNNFYFNVSMWDPAQLPLPRTNDLQISVHGEDEARVVLLLEEIRDMVNDSELYGRVFTDPPTGLSNQLSMGARTEIIDGFGGITTGSLTSMVSRILRGTSSLEFEEGQETLNVAAVFPEESLDSLEKLANFLIYTPEGIVPLKHFFDFEEGTDVAGIASEDGEHIFRVYGRMPSGSPAADREKFEGQIRDLMAEKISLPRGYTVSFDNPQEEMDSALRSLFIALGASIALIYLVLALQFNSLRLPLVILVTVPLGFIGVVVSLYVFKSTLSLNSLLGTILLAGIVVNNAIIMIDFYIRMAVRHENKTDAIIRAAQLRFAPILITMLTTILGMLPLAIGFGGGSNIVQPLGIAVSGGLFISTLFTLFVIPAVLSFVPRPVPAE
jgi:hydrophobic/amphiphilic exporter-1 (mainly G- bacteria), HAE1 family